LGGQNLVNLTSKNIKYIVFKNDCTCACSILHFYLLYVNGNAQNGCFCCLTVRSARGQKMAVRSTQGQNRAVRSSQGGGSCHPHVSLSGLLAESFFGTAVTCLFQMCSYVLGCVLHWVRLYGFGFHNFKSSWQCYMLLGTNVDFDETVCRKHCTSQGMFKRRGKLSNALKLMFA